MIDKMIDIVAGMFVETMNEENFESFEDMARCYWWDSKDIKDEITYGINNLCSDIGYIFDDGSEIMTWDEKENMSYRTFASRVKKKVNELVEA